MKEKMAENLSVAEIGEMLSIRAEEINWQLSGTMTDATVYNNTPCCRTCVIYNFLCYPLSSVRCQISRLYQERSLHI